MQNSHLDIPFETDIKGYFDLEAFGRAAIDNLCSHYSKDSAICAIAENYSGDVTIYRRNDYIHITILKTNKAYTVHLGTDMFNDLSELFNVFHPYSNQVQETNTEKNDGISEAQKVYNAVKTIKDYCEKYIDQNGYTHCDKCMLFHGKECFLQTNEKKPKDWWIVSPEQYQVFK